MFKKTLSLMIAVCLLLSSVPAVLAARTGSCGADAYWAFDEASGTLTITGTGPVEDYRDMNTIFERPWEDLRLQIRHLVVGEGITGLGAEAFSGCSNLETLTLPTTLEEIGNFCFYFAEKLRALDLPDGLLAIGQQAFCGCKGLTEVAIPDSVLFVDACAFDECRRLKKVTFGADMDLPAFVMGNSPFRGCTALQEILVEEGHIALTSVDGALFVYDGKGLMLIQYPLGKRAEEYTIPDGTYWIEQFSVENAVGLKRITLPASVEFVGTNGLCGSGLEKLRFRGSAPELATDALGILPLDVFYPADDATWTREVMQGQNANLRWNPYNPENKFWDVPPEAFYEKSVLWALEKGITSGTSDTAFSPYDSCLRSQVVTFLWRAAGKPGPKSQVNPFVDVKPTDYYYNAVLWAVENGITYGADDTHFEPNGVCNRSQVVTFLYRAFKKPPVGSVNNPFEDVSAGDWYASAVSWAVQEGIAYGTSETAFSPNDVCNRSQVVTFLYRAYN